MCQLYETYVCVAVNFSRPLILSDSTDICISKCTVRCNIVQLNEQLICPTCGLIALMQIFGSLLHAIVCHFSYVSVYRC